jgi:hypothetical protein
LRIVENNLAVFHSAAHRLHQQAPKRKWRILSSVCGPRQCQDAPQVIWLRFSPSSVPASSTVFPSVARHPRSIRLAHRMACVGRPTLACCCFAVVLQVPCSCFAFDLVCRARCRSSVGASPTRQLSFQPVVIGATMEVTTSSEPSMERAARRPREQSGRNVSER